MAQELNIDDVDKTMDEISEAQDQMQQMNDVLSQPIGTAADLDEDELAAELAVRVVALVHMIHSQYCLPCHENHHALQPCDCNPCTSFMA